MNGLVEILAAIVVWVAAVLLSPFGVEVGFARPVEPSGQRTIERTPPADPGRPIAGNDCPEGAKARLRPA